MTSIPLSPHFRNSKGEGRSPPVTRSVRRATPSGRLPAFAAIASACVGVATMIGLAAVTHGAARVAALGIGHTVAYTVGAGILGVGLMRRTGGGLTPRHLGVVVAYSSVLAALAWLAMRALAVVGSAGLVAYGAVARRWLQPADAIGAAA